jgi:hypothetical protein
MSSPASPTPAGWYPDTQVAGQNRYWDGAAWTHLTHVPGQPLPAGPPLKAPPGTPWNTSWIWLIIFLPLLPTFLLLFVPWGSIYDIDPTASNAYEGTRGIFDLLLSPFYWAAIVLSYVVYGLVVFFAFRDYKELAGRGVPRPFHWAFAFIGGVVYAIGRSVVVHRRTGDGHQPIWAEIGAIAVSLAMTIYILVVMFSGLADLVGGISTSA